MIEKIVSGGQTGVDRAGLDAAIDVGFACGGWCPRGRRAEDGAIPETYPLKETSSSDYTDRTRRNVEDSDGTLIVAPGKLTGGTLATFAHANRIGKPVFVIDLEENIGDAVPGTITDWLDSHRIRVLNIAGPRESGHPGIYREARELITRLLAHMINQRPS